MAGRAPPNKLDSFVSADSFSCDSMSALLLKNKGFENNFQENELKNFNGHLLMSQEPHPENAYVSSDTESLFYKVPNKLMTYIEGFPTLINQVHIDYNEENDEIEFCSTEDPFARKRFTIQVPTDKVFKLLEEEGLTKDNYDEELYGISNRHQLLTRAISKYAKKFLQITEYDPSMQEVSSPN